MRADAAADLLHEYVARHNQGVRSGDWRGLIALFAPDACVIFEGIAIGPFHGRDAIARAFATHPPDDELTLLDLASLPGAEQAAARYAWSRTPHTHAGAITLSMRGGCIGDLRITAE